MGVITITNSNRGIDLDRVTGYIIASQADTPSYDIPGRETPSRDVDATVVKPTTYNITANISITEYMVLRIMRKEKQLPYTIEDEENSPLNVRLDNIQFTMNVGKENSETDMWSVNIVLSGLDH